MKSTITLLLLCTGIIAFCSCSDENEGVVRNSSLRITTEIATRSVIESTSFNSGDQIGVFAFDANSTNVRATYINKWDLESDISLAEPPTPIYAYYPYTTDCDYQTVRVDIAPDAIVTGQADYLYGKSAEDVNATSPKALIRFKHALARITLSIKRSADDAGYGILSNVCLQNAGRNTVISTSGWMDVTTGKISSSGTGSISFDMNYTLSNETAQNVDILVIPIAMEKEGMAELALTIDGSQYMVKMPAATWEAGQQYTYPITINRTDAHITQAKVGDYYYSDGTWSTIYNTNKNCIGIVFALSKEKDGDIDVNLEESLHGRIVALTNTDKGGRWVDKSKDIEGIPNYSALAGDDRDVLTSYLPIDGYSRYSRKEPIWNLPYNYINWPTEKNLEFALTDYAGRKNTSHLIEDTQSAAAICHSYSLYNMDNGVWYLPAAGEMARLFMACAAGKISQDTHPIFKNLTKTYNVDITASYWTSTENTDKYAWEAGFGECHLFHKEKTTPLYVRPVSSF